MLEPVDREVGASAGPVSDQELEESSQQLAAFKIWSSYRVKNRSTPGKLSKLAESKALEFISSDSVVAPLFNSNTPQRQAAIKLLVSLDKFSSQLEGMGIEIGKWAKRRLLIDLHYCLEHEKLSEDLAINRTLFPFTTGAKSSASFEPIVNDLKLPDDIGETVAIASVARALERIKKARMLAEIIERLPYKRQDSVIEEAAAFHEKEMREAGIDFRYTAINGSLYYLPLILNISRVKNQKGNSELNYWTVMDNIEALHSRGDIPLDDLRLDKFWIWGRHLTHDRAVWNEHLRRHLGDISRFGDIDVFTFGIPREDIDEFRKNFRRRSFSPEDISDSLPQAKKLVATGKELDFAGHIVLEDLISAGPVYTKYARSLFGVNVPSSTTDPKAGYHLAHVVFCLSLSKVISSSPKALQALEEKKQMDLENAIVRVRLLPTEHLKQFNVAFSWLLKHHVFRVVDRANRHDFTPFREHVAIYTD